MRPANYCITRPEGLAAWMAGRTANNLAICIVNNCDLWGRMLWLLNCCRKQFLKYGGLDLDYLAGSSTLKDITRDARKTCGGTMEDDRTAREYLAGWILEYVSE